MLAVRIDHVVRILAGIWWPSLLREGGQHAAREWMLMKTRPDGTRRMYAVMVEYRRTQAASPPSLVAQPRASKA